MSPKTDPSAVVIPFGKHKGQTVAELLATDPQYADWLLAQGWLAERFAELHSAIQTRGAGADDTPEHNTIQGRFLDPLFRAAFIQLTQDIERAREQDWDHQTWSQQERLRQLAYYGQEYRTAEEAKINAELATISPLPLVSSVRFEIHGIDVRMVWGFVAPKDLYDHGDRESWSSCAPRSNTIEIKPSMGEDYPTVMRQMQRLHAHYLVVDSYTGRALPFETVRSMFEANGRHVVTVREIEAEIPNARALL